METRSEFHIAQQARRDKLRMQDSGDNSDNPFAVYTDFVPTGEMGYELCPCPEMLNIPANSRAVPAPQWKSIGSQFVVNYNPAMEATMFVGETLSSSSAKMAPNFLQQDPGLGFGPVAQPVSFPEKAMDPVLYTQGALSLSLSSVPAASDVGNAANLSRIRKDVVVGHRNPGPLGPFTGYAIILRNSKFLRPAHQLLEELCFGARPKIPVDEIRVSGEDSCSSSQVFNEQTRDSTTANHSPENLQTRARLLFLQEEVAKRYTQYHQQIQLVISSFETVAGLSSATPYVSLAVKSVSKHFRFLKDAIADYLKNLRNALGQDSSTVSNAQTDPTFAFAERGFLMSSKAATDAGGRHLWRPQRGLPERAVAVLRAWLFDHFLHPYPTDTDKHMLASQTGLTRSQVSNWFINARVRIWKPMVEEIHMLETKKLADETGLSPSVNGAMETMNQGLAQGHQHGIDQVVDESDGWNQDKRSRIDNHHGQPSVGFGSGSVSLTLGLRHSAENSAQIGLPENQHLRQEFGVSFSWGDGKRNVDW